MYKLIDREPRGAGMHRSGWPAVVQSLRARCASGDPDRTVLLDDFVEQSIDDDKLDHKEPWVGIFHHPRGVGHPDPNKRTLPQHFLKRDELRPVFSRLKVAIALSIDLADLLSDLLPGVTIRVLKHPAPVSAGIIPFDPERLNDGKLRIVQAGTYMRNIRGIHQIPASDEWDRLRTWIPPYYKKLDDFLLRIVRAPESEGVIEMPKLTDVAYDSMLSRSVIFVHYFDASASNTVLECIQRATPIVLNRMPAHEEYLGSSYPGFYTDRHEVVPILRDRDHLHAMHAHLLKRQSHLLAVRHFTDAVAELVWEAFRPMAPA